MLTDGGLRDVQEITATVQLHHYHYYHYLFFTFFPLEDISLDFSYPKIREKRKLCNVMLGLAIHLRKFQNVRYYIAIYAIY